jgi:hypothetical protein
LALLLAAFFPAGAGEAEPPPLRPDIQPLAVIRLKDFGFPEKFAAGRLASLLGLGDFDYSGRLPGWENGIISLREWLAALRKSGVRDFWYCLLPESGNPLAAAAILGGDWPSGETPPADWLPSPLPDSGRILEVSRPGGGIVRRLAARDAGVLARARAGSGEPVREAGDSWRESLAAFLARDPGGIAAWFNFRPLLGLASWRTGIDLRGWLFRLGLSLPDSLEAEAFARDGDLSFRIRLNHPLPIAEAVPSSPPAGLSAGPGSIRIRLSDPKVPLRILKLAGNPLAAANLDLRALIPERIDFSAWRDGGGEFHWLLSGPIRKEGAFLRHYPRLLAWLDIFAASPGSGWGISESGGRPGGFRRITYRGFSLVAGAEAAKPEGKPVFLAAGREGDLPAGDWRPPEPRGNEPLLAWEIEPDEISLGEAADWLAGLAGKIGLSARSARDFSAWLREGDAGSLYPSGHGLEVELGRGTAILWAAWLSGLLSETGE